MVNVLLNSQRECDRMVNFFQVNPNVHFFNNQITAEFVSVKQIDQNNRPKKMGAIFFRGFPGEATAQEVELFLKRMMGWLVFENVQMIEK